MRGALTRRPALDLSERQIGVIAILLSASLWGTTYVVAKFSLRELVPMTATFARFLVALLVTWPLLVLVRGRQPFLRRYVPYLIGLGLFQTTFYFALQYTGLRYTTVSNTSLIVKQSLWYVGLARLEATRASVLLFIVPVLNVIFAHLVLGEAITWALAAGGLLILAGTYRANRPRRPVAPRPVAPGRGA